MSHGAIWTVTYCYYGDHGHHHRSQSNLRDATTVGHSQWSSHSVLNLFAPLEEDANVQITFTFIFTHQLSLSFFILEIQSVNLIVCLARAQR